MMMIFTGSCEYQRVAHSTKLSTKQHQQQVRASKLPRALLIQSHYRPMV